MVCPSSVSQLKFALVTCFCTVSISLSIAVPDGALPESALSKMSVPQISGPVTLTVSDVGSVVPFFFVIEMYLLSPW